MTIFVISHLKVLILKAYGGFAGNKPKDFGYGTRLALWGRDAGAH